MLTMKWSFDQTRLSDSITFKEFAKIQNFIFFKGRESLVYAFGSFYKLFDNADTLLLLFQAVWRANLLLDVSLIRSLFLHLPVDLILPVFSLVKPHCIIFVPLVIVYLSWIQGRNSGYAELICQSCTCACGEREIT